MLPISKPLSGGQARTYHAREFAAKEANYWSREQQGHSEWQGKLAQEWGLQGAVGAEQFARLTEGQHPETQEQMVRHQPAKTYENQFGREGVCVATEQKTYIRMPAEALQQTPVCCKARPGSMRAAFRHGFLPESHSEI
jgi:hypothetical protein